jgi:4a-hydroxytetrahydrobiopterin dehydratase
MDQKDQIINSALKLKWRYTNNTLVKTFQFEDFDSVLNWINEVIAVISQEQNHHPNIIWEYNKATLIVYSHEVKDITNKDIAFIEAVEKETDEMLRSEKYL